MTRTPSWPASGNDRRTSCLKCCSPHRLMSPACPALNSIWPTEFWTGATAGKLKMHHVIHPLNDSHPIRDLTTGDKSSQRTLMVILSGPGVSQRCWDLVVICSTSLKKKEMYYCQNRHVSAEGPITIIPGQKQWFVIIDSNLSDNMQEQLWILLIGDQ